MPSGKVIGGIQKVRAVTDWSYSPNFFYRYRSVRLLWEYGLLFFYEHLNHHTERLETFATTNPKLCTLLDGYDYIINLLQQKSARTAHFVAYFEIVVYLCSANPHRGYVGGLSVRTGGLAT